jgi:hypothetical protein
VTIYSSDRRQFLAASATTLVGLSLPPDAAPSLHARTFSGQAGPCHTLSVADLASFNARTPAPVGTK